MSITNSIMSIQSFNLLNTLVKIVKILPNFDIIQPIVITRTFIKKNTLDSFRKAGGHKINLERRSKQDILLIVVKRECEFISQ